MTVNKDGIIFIWFESQLMLTLIYHNMMITSIYRLGQLGCTYLLTRKIPRTERMMMRRLQNIPIETIPGIPTPSSSELLPGCSACCPHSLPVSFTGKLRSSSGTHVMLIFSQDPELRQEMVTSTMPEIYRYFYCNTIE